MSPGAGSLSRPGIEPPGPFDAIRGPEGLDLSTFWAGAYLTCYLGAFGADQSRIDPASGRPSLLRFLVREGDDWYEGSPMWQGTNLNKRDITLDLTSDAGRELARDLPARPTSLWRTSPRVIEQFGLDYESLASSNPT